jgi:NADH:ubiquinone oxidoreductase subunit 6 (subunit J)
MRSQRLLNVTIWLALTSAISSILIYSLGAPEVAVIELSVGAGLVTVLFVFAFSIVGEITFDEITIVPRLLVWGLVIAAALLIGWLVLPPPASKMPVEGITFGRTLWQERGLDVIAQIVLIFAGVMGLLGLLSEAVVKKSAASMIHPVAMDMVGGHFGSPEERQQLASELLADTPKTQTQTPEVTA